MLYSSAPAKLTRRAVLLFAATAGTALRERLFASGSDFWNKEDPGQWSSEEIERLITKSPWAKEVTAEFHRSTGGGRGGGMGIPPIGGGIGIPPLGGGRRRGGSPGGMESLRVTVRWESAKPIREALKAPLPDSFAGRYVISVNGLPAMAGRGRGRPEERGEDVPQEPLDRIERLKAATFLQPKGKGSVQPGVVERQPSTGGASFLFGFLEEDFVLRPEDKEVTFTTAMGPIEVKAKFKLSEMVCRGELAL